MQAFEDYLKMPSRAVVAGQHTLDAEYFRRIEAMNFTLAHDDSQRTEELDKAEIVSRRRQPHLKDADKHLSCKPGLQDGQRVAGSEHSAAADAERVQDAFRGRSGREPGTDRRNPAKSHACF